MYRLTVIEPNVTYFNLQSFPNYSTNSKETFYFTDKEKEEFIIYKLLDDNRKVKRNLNDDIIYRIVHKISGYCIAQCERKDITPIIKHFQSINLDVFDRNGNVHGWIDNLEITMELKLHHTIEVI